MTECEPQNSSIMTCSNNINYSDIDFEYPTAGAQAQGYVSLLSELRTALNAHAAKKGETNPYQITVSIHVQRMYVLLTQDLCTGRSSRGPAQLLQLARLSDGSFFDLLELDGKSPNTAKQCLRLTQDRRLMITQAHGLPP